MGLRGGRAAPGKGKRGNAGLRLPEAVLGPRVAEGGGMLRPDPSNRDWAEAGASASSGTGAGCRVCGGEGKRGQESENES